MTTNRIASGGKQPYKRRLLDLQSLTRSPSAMVGMFIVFMVVLIAVAAPLFATHPPEQQDLTRALLPPAWLSGGDRNHILGTDPLGQDIYSRIIFGSRISLIVGLIAVIIQGGLGVLLGTMAGYFGGTVDRILMGIADLQFSIPYLILALAIVAVLGTGLDNVIIVLGLVGWVVYARVTRAAVLVLKEKEYIKAARAIGARDMRILFRHILPNIAPSILVIATMQVGKMITAEAALSFLGLGVQPPTPAWGSMVAAGRGYITTNWWVALFPGLAIFIAVLGINLLGDWLRDRFDPTLNT